MKNTLLATATLAISLGSVACSPAHATENDYSRAHQIKWCDNVFTEDACDLVVGVMKCSEGSTWCHSLYIGATAREGRIYCKSLPAKDFIEFEKEISLKYNIPNH